MDTEAEVQAELQRRMVKQEATQRETAGLLKAGWMTLFVGWALAIFMGFVGLAAMVLCLGIAIVIGIVVLVKGNPRGLVLMIASPFGSAIVGYVAFIIASHFLHH
jgi:hypothetical protein